uniref:Uncharacterized protein n=1 Tax=Anser cygnoides TaxID=8845 RepID=A0A8B9DBH3_ANSCY
MTFYLTSRAFSMLNIRATAKTELPKAPSTSAREKPKVFALCHLTRLNLTPSKPMIMEMRWERTAKASEAKERELPTYATEISTAKRTRRPIPAAPCPCRSVGPSCAGDNCPLRSCPPPVSAPHTWEPL